MISPLSEHIKFERLDYEPDRPRFRSVVHLELNTYVPVLLDEAENRIRANQHRRMHQELYAPYYDSLSQMLDTLQRLGALLRDASEFGHVRDSATLDASEKRRDDGLAMIFNMQTNIHQMIREMKGNQ